MIACFFIITALMLILSYLPSVCSLAAAVITLLTVIVLIIKHKKNAAVIAVTVFIYCISLCYVNLGIYSKTEHISKQNLNLDCTVIKCVNYENAGVLLVKTNDETQLPRSTVIELISYEETNLKAGNIINVNCTVTAVKDNILYNRSLGKAMTGVINDYVVFNKTSRVYYLSGRVREYIDNTFSENLERRDVLIALFTGEKSELSNSFVVNVRKSGVSHLLVVSGLHLSVICGSIYFVMRSMRLNKYFILAFSVLEAFIFVTLCNFTPSVLRASISFLIIVYAYVLNRRARGITTLFASGVIIMIFNPYAVCNVSFLLSFLASFGIIYFSPETVKLANRITANKYIKGIIVLALTTASAFIAVLPVSVYYFGYVSTVGIIVNILVSYAVTLILMLALLLLIISPLPFTDSIVNLLSFLIDTLANYFVNVVNYFGSLNISTLEFRNSTLLTVLIVISALIIFTCKNRIILLKSIRGENYADR